MKNLRKNIFSAGFLLLLCFCFLFHAKKTAAFAFIGLNTWFEQMIISLFPFLVLMNLLIKSGLTDYFIRPFYYILRPIFRNTPDAIFVIFFGFLCGFPLGCKSAVDLYKKGKISKENAEYLLCFTNNIGPAYMTGFFLGQIKPESASVFAFLYLYGIPLLYGILLRYTIYKKHLDRECVHYKIYDKSTEYRTMMSALPEAICDSLIQISMLGGYMVLFNAMRIIPHLLFSSVSTVYVFTQSILEISGGLLCVNTSLENGIIKELCLYAVFSFNGLCCHFQTFSVLHNTDLSAKKYMLHKILLCSITILVVWLFCH